jgi:hypothetical protein
MAKAIVIRDHVDDGLKDGENGCTTKVCINNRKQHVEGRERGTANSYRWCFGCRHRQSCDIARSQGNCVTVRLPLHNCGAVVPTLCDL